MKVLVLCEESQAVCKAFRELGHEAYSCDLQECSGGHPEWHFKFNAKHFFFGDRAAAWDLIIAHPPCTYLTSAGASRLFDADHQIKDLGRYFLGEQAASFFKKIYRLNCRRIAIENPTPIRCFNLPRYTQIVEPYMFGDPWHKRTCLWLKGLPELKPTKIVEPEGFWVGNNSKGGYRDQKQRSKTALGLAHAMAEQWG